MHFKDSVSLMRCHFPYSGLYTDTLYTDTLYTGNVYTGTLYTGTVLQTLVYQLLYTLQWQVTAAFKSSKWLPKIHNTSYLTYSQNSCWQHVKSSF